MILYKSQLLTREDSGCGSFLLQFQCLATGTGGLLWIREQPGCSSEFQRIESKALFQGGRGQSCSGFNKRGERRTLPFPIPSVLWDSIQQYKSRVFVKVTALPCVCWKGEIDSTKPRKTFSIICPFIICQCNH